MLLLDNLAFEWGLSTAVYAFQGGTISRRSHQYLGYIRRLSGVYKRLPVSKNADFQMINTFLLSTKYAT